MPEFSASSQIGGANPQKTHRPARMRRFAKALDFMAGATELPVRFERSGEKRASSGVYRPEEGYPPGCACGHETAVINTFE